MSTLTKVLIILLTLASMVLGGIVVTYVSTANNYKLAYEGLRQDYDGLEQKNAGLLNRIREQTASTQRVVDGLNKEKQDLQVQINKLKMDLSIAKTHEAELQDMVNGWASVIEGFKQTIQDMQASLTLARNELDKFRSEQVDDRQRLNEIIAIYEAQIVKLNALEAERRRLLEEKTTLEKMVQDLAKHSEQPLTAVGPATTIKEKAIPVRAVPDQVELKAAVTEVDLENSLAAIDIGSADGVELGMTFYVSRSNNFICNILITDVEPARAAGILELVQQPPRIGDNVTNREPGS